MIDKTGKWWKGQDFADLAEYLVALTADGYPADRVLEPQCICGARVFRLHGDRDEGVARRTCVACGHKAFICDSEEAWADAEPKLVKCPCGAREFQVGVAFSMRGTGDVRWITVGERCLACGVLGGSVDWSIDYSPSLHLLDSV